MPFLYKIRNLIDPLQMDRKAAELRREQARPEVTDTETTRRFLCRVCGRVEPQGEYCPDCLADTMVEDNS